MIDFMELTEKQQKRYDRIVDVAERLMHQQGFYKLSLTELTAQLKVSRSTIYENFGSKEGLIEVVVRRYNERIQANVREIISNRELSTYDKFIQLANQLAETAEGPNSFRFLTDLKIHAPELYDIYLQGRNDREVYWYGPLVKKAISEGLFDKKLKPDFILQSYLKVARLACDTDIVEKSSLNKAEAMDAMIKIFLNGSKKI